MRSTIGSELYADPLSLGADNSDVKDMLRSVDSQMTSYLIHCGAKQGDQACREMASLLGLLADLLVSRYQELYLPRRNGVALAFGIEWLLSTKAARRSVENRPHD